MTKTKTLRFLIYEQKVDTVNADLLSRKACGGTKTINVIGVGRKKRLPTFERRECKGEMRFFGGGIIPQNLVRVLKWVVGHQGIASC